MSKKNVTHLFSRILIPAFLFAVAFWMRLHFFSGYILCDDVEFFQLTQIIYTSGINFQGVLQYRFMVWLPHLLSFQLLGISETSFSLPIWVFSSSLCVIGYFLMRRWQYSIPASLLVGLTIAGAPFEILIGTVVSNDITLEWLMALALLSFVVWRRRPALLGSILALLFWLGFYTKLWLVYWIPLLGIYYLVELWKKKEWRGPASFTLSSLLLHSLTVCFWKWKMGMFFPFFSAHSATYPVPEEELLQLFGQYPHLIFQGSEYGTTLFGWLPYLLLILLAIKWILRFHLPVRRGPWALDGRDALLVSFYGTFFLFLNFFPNAFQFDQYYSMPRIFRYLAPISWPMALHLGKMICDLSLLLAEKRRSWLVCGVSFLLLYSLNWKQTVEATGPGVLYRKNLDMVLQDLNRLCPPKILVESWQSFFMQSLYLKGSCAQTAVFPVVGIYQATEYEEWLKDNLSTLPQGTVIISGIGSCIHYSCYTCGYRLAHFNHPLPKGWKLLREYESLSFLPQPEPIRLWQWDGSQVSDEEEKPAPSADLPVFDLPDFRGGAQEAFREGMNAFEKHDYPAARKYFLYILQRMPDSAQAEDTFYFHAVTYWREANLQKTITEFQRLLDRFPKGRQAPGAHYHMGMAYKSLGKTEEARNHFEIILRDFSHDENTAALAKEMLGQIPRAPLLQRFWQQ